MGAAKHNQAEKIGGPSRRSSRSSRSSQAKLEDYAPEVLVMAIGLQLLYFAGLHSKTAALLSSPALFGMLLCKGLVVVTASTWRRAIKFSILSTLTIPSVGLVYLAWLTIDASILKPNGPSVLKNLALTAKLTAEVWGIILLISIPAALVGAIIRFAWLKLRPNSQ